MKLFVFAPYGVHPARTAGHLVIEQPLRLIAAMGHEVQLVTSGLRKFERRMPFSFQQEISKGLTEHRLVSPLRLLKQSIGGASRLPPIDLADELGKRMPRELYRQLSNADLAQVESPWPFDFLKNNFTGPVIFVAHNVECDLHEEALLKKGGQDLLQLARDKEGRAWREADLAFVLHEAEKQRMEELYGARNKTSICLPLGTQIPDIPSDAERTSARLAAIQKLGLPQDRVIALFTGSAHAPNREAADFLIKSAQELSGDRFSILIAGSVCKKHLGANMNATGPLPSLDTCFQAADIAINPMMSGSGMNLKLIQYLSFALPVLSTDFGARGFEATQERGIVLAAREDFMASLSLLVQDEELRILLGKNARRYAEESFAWDNIVAARLRAMEALLGQYNGL